MSPVGVLVFLRGGGTGRIQISHGLVPNEDGPVFQAVTNRLMQLVESRENFLEAEALFKVLWRLDNCRVGPLSYPREINWQLIADYLNGPFSPIPELSDIATERARG